MIEVISKKSKNIPWSVRIDDKAIKNERIRIISIDKFYEIATGHKDAFAKLCKHLPKIIQDVIESEGVEIGFSSENQNIRESIREVHSNFLTALYYLAFSNYEGFKGFTQDQ